MAFKFIHAADIHLDSPLKGLERYEGAPVNDIREATRHALLKLVDLAIEQQVDFVLIAGDIYDGDWKDHNTGLFFVKNLTRLQNAGICVYAITGNHDAENKMTKTVALPDNPDGTPVMLSAKKAETICPPDLNVAIHGRGFAKAKETNNIVLKYPSAVSGKFNIGMLHTAMGGADGHEPYAPCAMSDLESRQYQYWALGHVHNRERLTTASDAPVVFPGNIQGRHIRETGPKGCEVVTVDDSGNIESTFEPLDVFRWEHCHVDATGTESGDDIVDRFSDALRKIVADADGLPLAVRTHITGSTAAHSELMADQTHWTQQLRAKAFAVDGSEVWLEKVRYRTTESRELSAEELENGPVGELLSFFDDLRDDEALLHDVSSELDGLTRKLPEDMVRGDDAIVPADPEQLKKVLDEVQPLLIHRLLNKEVSA